jgi:transaldolase
VKATRKHHDIGQSLWMDNITREQLNTGALEHAIEEWSVTGMTSSPVAFKHAVLNSAVYDGGIQKMLKDEIVGEELFFELVLEDLRHAADLFRPVYDKTKGLDGWVSLDASPLMTYDTSQILTIVKDLYVRAQRPNFFIGIPGTIKNLTVIEEAISAGVPVNVTLLFSREHYLAAAEAFLCGIERRIKAGIRPNVGSVVSFPISRWDTEVNGKVPETLQNQLGMAMAGRIYKACQEFLSTPRWKRVYEAGARPQRILWAGMESSDPKVSNFFYIKALAVPLTVCTLAGSTLKAFSDQGKLDTLMPANGGDCETVLRRFTRAGINIDGLADQLQEEAASSFLKSWVELMMAIASKSASLTQENSLKGELT